MMEMIKKKTWVVIGATDNTEKFGYIIYKHLKSRGYEVFPVNPNCDEIDGNKCYTTITQLPKTPDVLNMVVSPKRGKPIITEAARLGVKNIWFQPGSSDSEIISLAKSFDLNVVEGCVLTQIL